MRRNRQWRRIHAGRDFLQSRQNTTPDSQDREASDDSDSSDDILPGPITITFTTTIPVETVASSTEWTTQTSITTSTRLGLPIRPPSSSTTATASQTSITSTSTTSSTSSSQTTDPNTSTVPAPSHTWVDEQNDPTTTPRPQENLSSTSTSLSAGSIAGILIAILAVVAFAVVFFLRKRFINKRKRATGAWTTRSGLIGPGIGSNSNFKGSSEPKSYNFEPSPALTRIDTNYLADDAGAIGKLTVRNRTPTDVTPPPTAFNTRSTPSMPSVVVSSLDSGTPTVGVSLAAPSAVSPFQATVTSTYIVTLPDELSITVGERMRILAEYDDGWALCMNTSGEQGMAPLECLDRGNNGATFGLQAQHVDVRASRRFSSLSPLTAGGMSR